MKKVKKVLTEENIKKVKEIAAKEETKKTAKIAFKSLKRASFIRKMKKEIKGLCGVKGFNKAIGLLDADIAVIKGTKVTRVKFLEAKYDTKKTEGDLVAEQITALDGLSYYNIKLTAECIKVATKLFPEKLVLTSVEAENFKKLNSKLTSAKVAAESAAEFVAKSAEVTEKVAEFTTHAKALV